MTSHVLSLALVALTGLGPPGGHPDSISRSRLVVRGAMAELELRCQALTLIEALPALDGDGDLALSAAELASGSPAIERYVLERYRLVDLEGEERPLAGALVSAAELAGAPAGPLQLAWLSLRFAFEGAGPLGVLGIESEVFREENPWHRDVLAVDWNGEPEVHRLFVAGATRWRFEPAGERRSGVLGLFLRLGFEHILTGWDHLAFLAALIVAVARVRALVGVVTAFTLAHTITLAAVALDPGGLLDRVPDRLIELAIALSIAYVGAETLIVRRARTPWIEAFVFGLLHGLGFAGFLGDALAGEPLVVTALLGFNLGVELGQLVVVALVAALLLVGLRRRASDEERGEAGGEPPPLVPVRLRSVASATVAVLGLYWFVERAGWL